MIAENLLNFGKIWTFMFKKLKVFLMYLVKRKVLSEACSQTAKSTRQRDLAKIDQRESACLAFMKPWV
jgi:hypothetical protein